MIAIPSLFAMLILLALMAGCGARNAPSNSAETAGNATGATESGSPATGAAATATPPAGEGHAGAGVVPGSYEDWCEEHQVPETQCTRCDPSLIPAFQAANDWCAGHGLPMSQCTLHDPNLKIVRPAKPEGR